jgi:solute carrier family 25 (mitochondrial phosphate transporter), member 3
VRLVTGVKDGQHQPKETKTAPTQHFLFPVWSSTTSSASLFAPKGMEKAQQEQRGYRERGISSLMMPTHSLTSSIGSGNQQVMATSANPPSTGATETKYNLMYYLKGALAGGICTTITHGALTPVDVVKTKIQLDPVKYNRGLVGGIKQVIAEEGTRGLLTGFGPTVVGYFIQGWFKFGGVEFFKINIAQSLGEQSAWDNRTAVYLGASAMAEFVADIFLCPIEATRIRLVSNPSFASGLVSGAARLYKEEGFIKGFYSGFGPILFKQIPYTMAKFAVQDWAAEKISSSMGKKLADLNGSVKLGVALSSGVIAGVAAAIISHPADTLLSKVNKAGAGGSGSITSRLVNIAKEIGFVKLCTVGLGARCVMVGTLTAGQFLLFDIVMDLTGAQRFYFNNPNSNKDAHH